MIIEKNSTLRALVKGIYLLLTFDNNGVIINFEELNTTYLLDNNITLENIKELVGTSRSNIAMTVKAVLTINRKNLDKAIEYYNNSFNETIINCLKQKTYLVSLLICGKADNIDEYDEFFDCNICKYFTEFYRVPKVKLRQNINEDELKTIISVWSEKYLFEDILINGKNEFNILSLCTEHILDTSKLIWKHDEKCYYPYIREKMYLNGFNIKEFLFTNNININNNTYYTINKYIISSNIINSFYDSLKENNITDFIFTKGQFIKQ